MYFFLLFIQIHSPFPPFFYYLAIQKEEEDTNMKEEETKEKEEDMNEKDHATGDNQDEGK